MFKWYGCLGIALILFTEVNFFLKLQPFANWYFPIVWLGYILVVDALIYKLKKDSLLSNRKSELFGLFIVSILFWYLFEFLNLATHNWSYSGTQSIINKNLFGTLAFATVLPALFETVELIRALNLFSHTKLKKHYRITKFFLHTMMLLGFLCFFLPYFFPRLAFPLIWLSFFLLLDPLNYLHQQPSIIGHLKDRRLTIPLSLLLAGITLGFLWEFWNYWALPKWTYDIPYLGFLKLFEMPVLGYLGYFPFALELYAMYWFVRSLFIHKEHLLVA